MVTTPKVSLNPKYPGYPHRQYVAPVTKTEEGGKRRITGWRLTQFLPADAASLRYYQRKGFRLATEADIIRFLPPKAPEPKIEDDVNLVTVKCSICQTEELLDVNKVEAALQYDLTVEMVCGHMTRIDRSLVQWLTKGPQETHQPYAKAVIVPPDDTKARTPEKVEADRAKMEKARSFKKENVLKKQGGVTISTPSSSLPGKPDA